MEISVICNIQLLELQLRRYYGNPPSLRVLPRDLTAPLVMGVVRLFYSHEHRQVPCRLQLSLFRFPSSYSVFGTSDVSPD
jgi:hypothetical protein